MHEMSLALEICRVTEEQVGARQLPNVVTVAVDVGEDAGVEFANLEFCLEALLSNPPFGRARAVINREAGDDLRVAYLEVDDGNPDD
jgi:Zn finger protein HypA/HybF involved in hydrogenase expression